MMLNSLVEWGVVMVVLCHVQLGFQDFDVGSACVTSALLARYRLISVRRDHVLIFRLVR